MENTSAEEIAALRFEVQALKAQQAQLRDGLDAVAQVASAQIALMRAGMMDIPSGALAIMEAFRDALNRVAQP